MGLIHMYLLEYLLCEGHCVQRSRHYTKNPGLILRHVQFVGKTDSHVGRVEGRMSAVLQQE